MLTSGRIHVRQRKTGIKKKITCRYHENMSKNLDFYAKIVSVLRARF